jgi:hypothetical protein
MNEAVFDLPGILLAVYTAYAAVRGSVYARSGAWGRTVHRGASPEYFWTVIAIYAALSLALLFLF